MIFAIHTGVGLRLLVSEVRARGFWTANGSLALLIVLVVLMGFNPYVQGQG